MGSVQELNKIIESLKTIIKHTNEINSLYSITSDKREILRNDTSKLSEIVSKLKEMSKELGEPRLKTIAESIEILMEDRRVIDDKKTVSRTDHLVTMDNHAGNIENGYSDRAQQEANYTLLEGLKDELEVVKEDLSKDDKRIEELQEKIEKINKKEKILRIINEVKSELPPRIQESIDKELVSVGLIPMTEELTYTPTIDAIRKMNIERWKSGNQQTKEECMKFESIFQRITKKINEVAELNRELNPEETIESIQKEIDAINQKKERRTAELEKQKIAQIKEKELLDAMKDLPSDFRLFFAQKLSDNGLYTEGIDRFLSINSEDSYELGEPGHTSIRDYTTRSEQIEVSIKEAEEELEKYQQLYNNAVVEKSKILPNSDVTQFSDVTKYADTIKMYKSRINSLTVEQKRINKVIRAYNITNKLINSMILSPEEIKDEQDILALETESVAPQKEETKEEVAISDPPKMEASTQDIFENLLKLTRDNRTRIQKLEQQRIERANEEKKTQEPEGLAAANMLKEKLNHEIKENPIEMPTETKESEGLAAANMLKEKLNHETKETPIEMPTETKESEGLAAANMLKEKLNQEKSESSTETKKSDEESTTDMATIRKAAECFPEVLEARYLWMDAKKQEGETDLDFLNRKNSLYEKYTTTKNSIIQALTDKKTKINSTDGRSVYEITYDEKGVPEITNIYQIENDSKEESDGLAAESNNATTEEEDTEELNNEEENQNHENKKPTRKLYGRKSVIAKRKERFDKIKNLVKKAKKKIAFALLLIAVLGTGAYKIGNHTKNPNTQETLATNTDTRGITTDEDELSEEELEENALKEWEDYIAKEKETPIKDEELPQENITPIAEELDGDRDTILQIGEEDKEITQPIFDYDSYRLGDTVTTSTDTIYEDMYNMESRENGKHAYYGNDVERSVTGIVYMTPDGELHLANTQKEANDLEKSGARLIGYRTGDNITFEAEGYYPYQDVQVKGR